jgi:glutathione S-transferase
MELYYSPLACSLAARIVCLEAGLPVALRRIDLANKRIDGEEGEGLWRLNPFGKVPTLVCDDGQVLTENVSVLLYLGDRAPAHSRLMPEPRSPARYEVVKWLSFVATELHKRVLAVVFSLENPPEAAKQFARDGAIKPLAILEAHLRDRRVLVGESFTVVDAYLLWALLLLPRPLCGVSLDPYPVLRAYQANHMMRSAVRNAMATEYEEYKQPGWWTASALKGAP